MAPHCGAPSPCPGRRARGRCAPRGEAASAGFDELSERPGASPGCLPRGRVLLIIEKCFFPRALCAGGESARALPLLHFSSGPLCAAFCFGASSRPRVVRDPAVSEPGSKRGGLSRPRSVVSSWSSPRRPPYLAAGSIAAASSRKWSAALSFSAPRAAVRWPPTENDPAAGDVGGVHRWMLATARASVIRVVSARVGARCSSSASCPTWIARCLASAGPSHGLPMDPAQR